MQPDHVPLGVRDQRDETVLADGEFLFEYTAARRHHARGLRGAVLAREINQRAPSTRRAAWHMNERTGRAIARVVHSERPHFQLWSRKFFELRSEDVFVKRLRAIHVLNIDFKPTDRIVFHSGESFGLRSASVKSEVRLLRV